MFRNFKKKFHFFFNSGHERSLLAKKNALISVLIKGFSVLTSLFLVSFSIKLVSANEYGVWLTLSSVIGWFSFFDIGLGNGLKNKLSSANAVGDLTNAKKYVSSTYGLIFGVSLILFLSFLIANFFLDWKSILNVQQAKNYSLIATIVFASFCLQLFFQLIYSVLTALHKISEVAILSFLGQLLSLFTILILDYYSKGNLLNLVLAFTIPPILIQIIVTIYLFKGKLNNISPSPRQISKKDGKELLNTGWMFFLIQIGALLLFQTDNIIIIQVFDAKMVTSFNVTYKLFSVVIVFFTVLMTPFWTAFTDAYAKNDIKWIEKIMRKLNFSIFFVALLTTILLLFSQQIFKLWLSEEVTTWTSLSAFVAIYTVAICWMTVQCYFLNGLGKIRLQFYLYIFATIINIPLAIFLGKEIGVNGIIISNIVVVLFISYTLHVQANKLIKRTAKGIWLN